MNLVTAIKETEQQITDMECAHSERIKDLKDGLAALRKLNTVCERCGGNGSVRKPRTCAEDDDRYQIACPECHGTGKAVRV